MALVYLEKKPKCADGKSYIKESTLKYNLCRAVFPIEYGKCPSCNMLK